MPRVYSLKFVLRSYLFRSLSLVGRLGHDTNVTWSLATACYSRNSTCGAEVSVFRHREDRLPVALILATSAVDLCVYLLVENLWALVAYFLFMVVPRGIISAWNHHHQHVPTFRSAALNRALELVYGLHTGMPTNLWTLHHVLGHHLNYLDQTKDESRWARADGSQMGELEYTFNVTLTAYPRAVAVGKRHPRALRPFLLFGTLTWLVCGALVWARPLQGLFVYLLPMVTTLFYTAWVTYDHHAGLESDNAFEGSYNIMNAWFNRLTGNLGFHTAHHYRQGVHWSRLPELHQRIRDRIPQHCYTESFFDVLLPGEAPIPAPRPGPAVELEEPAA